MRVATWERTEHIKSRAPVNDRINNIICSVISSLTEVRDSSRADVQPSSVSKADTFPRSSGEGLGSGQRLAH